jgi:S1-C subfamily serine protease
MIRKGLISPGAEKQPRTPCPGPGALKMVIVIVALLGLAFQSALAEKGYVWRDKDGNIHFSDRKPDPEEAGDGLEERKFLDASPPAEEEEPLSRNPIEHAINCTFRLANKRGGGSGFFVNGEGLAVTAKHVVEGISYSMKAEIPGDDKKHPVRILARSRKHDLALLKVVIGKPTPYLEIREVDTLVRGEVVFAIGNPLLAFKETITGGNFSRIFLEKDWREEVKIRPPFKGDWIQFSAPIIGGNSGGPLIDKEGRVIGVVSLRLTIYGAINFAVPASYILREFKAYLN